MPNLLQTAAELGKMLDTGIAGSLPIAIENIPYDEVEGQSYIRTLFIPYSSNNVTIGRTRRVRTNGDFQIRIRAAIDKGIGEAYSLADSIKLYMENQNPLPNLFTYTMSVRRIGEGSDGWYNLICDLEFTTDDT